jgi:hypothetical protein
MVDQDRLKKALEQVAKLRELSKSQNANEAAAAAAAAARIIDKFRISEAQLEAEMDAADREPVQNEEDPIITANPKSTVIAQWKVNLANSLGRHFGVYVLRVKRGGKQLQDIVTLTGRSSDVQVVRYFYDWLSKEVERLAHKANIENGKGGASFTVTYKNGCVAGIDYQLREMKKEERPKCDTAALVVLDSRLDESKKTRLALYDESFKVRQSGGGWGSDPNAFNRGHDDGKKINLGHHLGAGDGKVITGNKLLK